MPIFDKVIEMTTALGKRYLTDQSLEEKGSSPLSSSPRQDATSQLLSHLVNTVNLQVQADTEIEKYRIDSAAEIEKDKNSQHYTLLGSSIGVFGA